VQLKRKSAPFGVEIIFLRLSSPFQAKNNKKSLAATAARQNKKVYFNYNP
jgi:hypothetical protein